MTIRPPKTGLILATLFAMLAGLALPTEKSVLAAHHFRQSHCESKDSKPKYPWYIFNPRSCSGPAVERATPLLAGASHREVRRAGWAHKLFPWATPSDTCDYTGYFVGGGGGHCCGGNCCGVGDCCPKSRGTWGWDYEGSWIPRIVRLAWTRPPRYQGGAGQYEPDGPKFPHKTPEMLLAPH